LRRAHPLCWCLDMKSVVDAFKALKALPVSAVILDASGVIVAVNDTWKEFGWQNGLRIPKAGVGVNYLQYCAGSEFTRELRELLAPSLHARRGNSR
jgi:hypothetical protein